MGIKYFRASDVKKRVDEIADVLELFNVVPQFVYCVRSKGSKSRRTVPAFMVWVGFGKRR